MTQQPVYDVDQGRACKGGLSEPRGARCLGLSAVALLSHINVWNGRGKLGPVLHAAPHVLSLAALWHGGVAPGASTPAGWKQTVPGCGGLRVEINTGISVLSFFWSNQSRKRPRSTGRGRRPLLFLEGRKELAGMCRH